MEMITMFISHCVKVAEYFVVTGLPDLSGYSITELAQAWFWQTAKIIEIYMSIL